MKTESKSQTSKKKVVRKKIKGFAVVNTDINDVCVFVVDKEVCGAAVFTSDWQGTAKYEAQEYIKKQLNGKAPKRVKILPITITYVLPTTNKRKK